MIWNYWNTRQLQSALDDIDDELYDNLIEMLPPLRGDSYNPTEIDSKENLVKLLMAFAPSDYFSKKKNMEFCLSKLPPNLMRKLAREISQEMNLNINHRSFEDSLQQISRIRWNNRNFASIFLTFFDLPRHFMPPEKNLTPSSVDIFPIADDNPPIIPRPFKNLIDYQNQVSKDASKKLEIPVQDLLCRCRLVPERLVLQWKSFLIS